MTHLNGYYTSSGGVTCRLSIAADYAQIVVKDTGSGIPAEQQDHIFEPFARLPEHSHLEGTGMGLTITRLICQHLGCKLSLTESSRQGSVFRIRIPYEVHGEPQTSSDSFLT